MQESLLSQGADLMLFGMGTVFFFLAVLVLVTTSMSALVVRFFPEPPAAGPNTPLNGAPKGKHTSAIKKVDPKVLKVAQAAIDAHRK